MGNSLRQERREAKMAWFKACFGKWNEIDWIEKWDSPASTKTWELFLPSEGNGIYDSIACLREMSSWSY